MKTFILGLGAQKSGSSWLYEFLNTNSSVKNGPKEYQVWNTVDNVIPLVLDKPSLGWHPMTQYFQKNPNHYFDFFMDAFFSTHNFAYDITPNYSALSKERLASIKEEFAKRGVSTKVIFIMRDPIDRLLSSYKHAVRRPDSIKYRTGYPDDINTQSFYQYATSEFSKNIGRYENTYKNVAGVFDESDYLFLIYEDLFNNNASDKIAKFLNIDFNHDFVNIKVNSAPDDQSVNVSEEMKKEVALEYIETYRCMLKIFPEIKDLWPSFKYLD